MDLRDIAEATADLARSEAETARLQGAEPSTPQAGRSQSRSALLSGGWPLRRLP